MKVTLSDLFIIVAVLSLSFLTSCDHSKSKIESDSIQPQAKAVRVSVVKIKPVPIRDVIYLPGETEAWQDVRAAADTSGRIEWIGPQEGEKVLKGELLVKIDVSALKAALDRAEAAYKLADKLYQRRQRLFERKIITQEELDRSLTERTLAYTELQQAKVNYSHGFLRSPITGIVNHLFVDVGEFIETGKPLVDLVNVDKIKINAHVPELDVRYLRAGQKTQVKIDAFSDRQFMGRIDFVAYKADPATKTFIVRSVIDNPTHDIRPGMIARVAFLRRVIPDALVAPLFSLVDKGGERILFVEKDGFAHARTISIGVIEGDRVQITSGLKVGDHLIVTGQREVEEGMKVEVK